MFRTVYTVPLIRTWFIEWKRIETKLNSWRNFSESIHSEVIIKICIRLFRSYYYNILQNLVFRNSVSIYSSLELRKGVTRVLDVDVWKEKFLNERIDFHVYCYRRWTFRITLLISSITYFVSWTVHHLWVMENWSPPSLPPLLTQLPTLSSFQVESSPTILNHDTWTLRVDRRKVRVPSWRDG